MASLLARLLTSSKSRELQEDAVSPEAAAPAAQNVRTENTRLLAQSTPFASPHPPVATSPPSAAPAAAPLAAAFASDEPAAAAVCSAARGRGEGAGRTRCAGCRCRGCCGGSAAQKGQRGAGWREGDALT